MLWIDIGWRLGGDDGDVPFVTSNSRYMRTENKTKEPVKFDVARRFMPAIQHYT